MVYNDYKEFSPKALLKKHTELVREAAKVERLKKTVQCQGEMEALKKRETYVNDQLNETQTVILGALERDYVEQALRVQAESEHFYEYGVEPDTGEED
jgi:hypothetical protein